MKIMLFSASWCGPCQILKSKMSDLDGIGSLNIEKYELSNNQNREIASKYGVMSVPTMIIEKNNGEIIEYRSVGRIYDKLKNLLEVNV